MIDILIIIILSSFWILGINIVTQKEMLLYSVREWAMTKTSTVYKAIILCVWCMPSIHCLLGYVFGAVSCGIKIDLSLIFAYPVIVCATSFVTGVLWTLYMKIETQRSHLENLEQLSYFDIKDRKKNHYFLKK